MIKGPFDYGISTGVCRVTEDESLMVYLHISGLGSVTLRNDVARMIAAQIWMAADLLEPQDGENGTPIDGN